MQFPLVSFDFEVQYSLKKQRQGDEFTFATTKWVLWYEICFSLFSWFRLCISLKFINLWFCIKPYFPIHVTVMLYWCLLAIMIYQFNNGRSSAVNLWWLSMQYPFEGCVHLFPNIISYIICVRQVDLLYFYMRFEG